MDIMGLLQHMRAGIATAKSVVCSRCIARRSAKYRQWANNYQLLEAEKLPPRNAIEHWLDVAFRQKRPNHMVSSVEPFRSEVEQWVEEHLTIRAIYIRFTTARLSRQLWVGAPLRQAHQSGQKMPTVTVQVERPPGDEAQVDFGYAGKLLDEESGAERRTWAFVMTLAWSRHQYVEFVTDQRLETWLRCHRRAFQFINGVPKRVVVDNLKAAIVKACFEEPQAQLAYRECAEHYIFSLHLCRPYTPQRKAKWNALSATSRTISWRHLKARRYKRPIVRYASGV